MIGLKSINADSIPSALERAKQYRLLGEPDEAESICLDILEADPAHQDTLITLLLARTDKFGSSGLVPSFDNAKSLVDKLDIPYCRSYYLGIIYERRGKYHLRQGGPGSGTAAHQWLVKAMEAYQVAMDKCDPENQDAILRWNSCARIINSNPEIKPETEGDKELLLDAYDDPH